MKQTFAPFNESDKPKYSLQGRHLLFEVLEKKLYIPIFNKTCDKYLKCTKKLSTNLCWKGLKKICDKRRGHQVQ